MISDNVLQCRSSLDDRQRLLQSDHFNFDLEKREMSQCNQLQQLVTWEEKFLKQKSRCQWINESDQNSLEWCNNGNLGILFFNSL